MVLLVVAGALACIWLGVSAARAIRASRGIRVVTCPENGHSAAIGLDVGRAILTSPVGPGLWVRECSRWRSRGGGSCVQGCLAQVALARENGRVEEILSRWFGGQRCALCNLPFGEIRWDDRPPSLLAPDGSTCAALDVAPEEIPEALARARPICYLCDAVQTLRRERPDLMVDPSASASESER
jgi:hypothetical protein